jgi:hypothetical protein
MNVCTLGIYKLKSIDLKSSKVPPTPISPQITATTRASLTNNSAFAALKAEGFPRPTSLVRSRTVMAIVFPITRSRKM